MACLSGPSERLLRTCKGLLCNTVLTWLRPLPHLHGSSCRRVLSWRAAAWLTPPSPPHPPTHPQSKLQDSAELAGVCLAEQLAAIGVSADLTDRLSKEGAPSA